MKTKFSLSIAIITILLSANSNITIAQTKTKEAGNIQLFNGKDLNNWVFYLKDKTVDPASVFTIRNGVIHISGNPFGYMRTKDTYSDYRLHVEWRWPCRSDKLRCVRPWSETGYDLVKMH